MGVLSRLLRSRKHIRKGPPEHEVIVHFTYGSTNFQHIYAIEDLLRMAISEAGAGEYDRREVADDGSDGVLYMYGPNAENLFRAISPVLASFPFMRGATVTLHFGPPKRSTPKRIIQLPS
jgi:hypothetical protein